MKRNIMKLLAVLLAIITLSGVFTGCAQNSDNTPSQTIVTNEPTRETQINTEPSVDELGFVPYTVYNLEEDCDVKNIILMIGDGMGENIITNAEIVKGDKMAMQCMPHKCYVTTDSLSGVTDSAAAATAISCGIKTKNQYVGFNENYQPVETIVEFAKARGLSTGLVATQIVSHATPAAMVAHYGDRNSYNILLKQMIFAGVDVIYGGGSEYANTPKNLQRLEDNGYTYITSPRELKSDQLKAPVLGCFAFGAMAAGTLPSLTDMTASALDLLSNDNGFFLMVEGSNIDAKESVSDMEGTLKEMQAFDKCVDYVLAWAQKNPGTLVIVTADHETGGVQVPEIKTAENVTDELFTSNGEHTSENVPLFAAGAQAGSLFDDEIIDNTDIAKIMRKALNDTYGEAETIILNQ